MKNNKKEKAMIEYCETCDEEREYTLHHCMFLDRFREIIFEYEHTTARCKVCRNVMCVPKVEDKNLNHYYEEVNKIKNNMKDE